MTGKADAASYTRRAGAGRAISNPLHIAGHVTPPVGNVARAVSSLSRRAPLIQLDATLCPEVAVVQKADLLRGALHSASGIVSASLNVLVKRPQPPSRAPHDVADVLKVSGVLHGSHREGVRSHEIAKVLQGAARDYR